MFVSVGDSWSLPTVTALDETDGDLTDDIIFDDGSYDLNTVGIYYLTWTVEDYSANSTSFIVELNVTEETLFSDTTNDYYTDLNGLSGTQLEDALYILLNDTGTYETTTYGDARYYLEETDVIYGDSSHLNLIYSLHMKTGYLAVPVWDGGATWNREHVWAKSLFGTGNYSPSDSTRGIEADLHNLRAADTLYNSTRNNNIFSSYLDLETFGLDNEGNWYPGDDYRGDVARIIFYMDIRWGSDTDISNIGNLATLIEWASLDPVDDFEINRNNIIYGYQNNRNPFIDHPELVSMIYG